VRSKILPEYCTSGRPLEELAGAVIHYFSAKNVDPENQFDLETCRNLFLDLNRAKIERKFYMFDDKWPAGRMYASAHLVIGRGGETWRLVEYEKQAYHAGASILNGRRSCNRWTLGIELIGTIDSGFTPEQYQELATVLAGLEVDRANIAGHDEVRHNAIEQGSKKRAKYDPSGRKDGQGDNFDWNQLYHLMDEIAAKTTSPVIV
jgi:N-acetyl-anhydromuramyl-L-alanine amidase AmpD